MHNEGNKKQKKYAEQGFTLVETLVAITIFLLVILGPMTIASRGLQSAFYANEQATATFLAQEAIESVLRLRDENALDVLDGGGGANDTDTWNWYGGMPASCKNSTGCGYDPSANSLSNAYFPCNGSACLLKANNNPSDMQPDYYAHGTGAIWEDSIYTRKIFLEETNPGMVKITVNVSWGTALFSSGSRTITLQSWIMDHYNRFEP